MYPQQIGRWALIGWKKLKRKNRYWEKARVKHSTRRCEDRSKITAMIFRWVPRSYEDNPKQARERNSAENEKDNIKICVCSLPLPPPSLSLSLSLFARWVISFYLKRLIQFMFCFLSLFSHYQDGSSSSSCRAATADLSDPLLSPVSIIHRSRGFFKATSCCILVFAGRPAFACPCEGVHRSMSLMS